MTEVLPTTAELYDRPREECGVVGIFAFDTSFPVAQMTTSVLRGLQHRGEEAAGVGANMYGADALGFAVQKGLGLVTDALPDGGLVLDLMVPTANIATGHTRYGTVSGEGDGYDQAQPLVGAIEVAEEPPRGFLVVHNGNFSDFGDTLDGVTLTPQEAASDTSVVTALLARSASRLGDLHAAVHDVLPKVKGAFVLIVSEQDRLMVARDPQGVRPAVLGLLPNNGGVVAASEPPALAAAGATFLRYVERGEVVSVTKDGITSSFLSSTRRALARTCIFEDVYLARSDSELDGRNVHDERLEMGRVLAREHPVDADVVIGVPDSGLLSAMGYAEKSGIPFRFGFRKDPYSSRSFIQANQALRAAMVSRKLSVIRSVVRGKRVVVTDDSIMRGTSSLAFMNMLWEAGATEVHARISSPPNKNGCRHGIDTGDPNQLLARVLNSDIDKMRVHIRATSLGFISVGGLLDATGLHGQACTECMTGDDPMVDRLPVFLGMPAVAAFTT